MTTFIILIIAIVITFFITIIAMGSVLEKEHKKELKKLNNIIKELENKNSQEKQITIKDFQNYYEEKIKNLENKIENKSNIEEQEKLKNKIKQLEEENKELKAKLNQQKENYKNYLKNKEENIKKGQEYEYKIKCYFENLGYSVYPNGYIKGKNDKGIDLIAYKNNEMHLIQCKCYKKPPKQELIRKFIGDCELYIKNNKNKLNNKTIYKDFITSCKDKDYGVIKFLEENKNVIDYLIIE